MGFLSSAWKGLKGAATIGSFIPGVNAVAIPARAAMAGIDMGRNIRKKNWAGAGFNLLEAAPGLGKLASTGQSAGRLRDGSQLLKLPYGKIGRVYDIGRGLRGAASALGNIPEPVRRLGLARLSQMQGGGQRGGYRGGAPAPAPWFLRPTVAMADGGVAGIPRLPDDYEGYVDGPHLKSIGGNGPEVVVPLWKLMNQTRG